MNLAMLEYQATGEGLRPQARAAAKGALTRAPLADEPFFLEAMAAIAEGKRTEATRLLVEARRRNPRARYARLMLLDHYLRTDRIDEATAEMTTLRTLIPEAGGALIGELARLARSPATSGALERALQRNPAPRDELLEYLATNGGDPGLILRLARNVPALPSGAGVQGPPAWQARLVTSLVERGEVGQAYRLWRDFAGGRAPERKEGLYDPDLRGLPGTAPFNWSFPVTTAGVAEPSSTGLQVQYYGRDGAELAAQLLTLVPGRYRLSFVAEGSADGESSKLSWTMTCQRPDAPLGELVLRNVEYKPQRITGLFTVPASCAAQWLKLIGTPAEFTKPQSVTIRSIKLEKAR